MREENFYFNIKRPTCPVLSHPVLPCPTLSVCAGWVAVTVVEGDQVLLRVHGPEAVGFSLRMPPLLPHVISLKGERIRKSAAYKPMKPPGLLDSGLSARGAERLQVKRKKKKKGPRGQVDVQRDR